MTPDINKKFLERLQGDGVTEITDLTHNLGGIDKYDGIIDTKKDLYFISFLPNEKRYELKESGEDPRTKNEHVKGIKYFKADFDIRSNAFRERGRVISEEELLEYKDKILEGLKRDEFLSTYTAVVHSGNGIHVYWIGDMIEIDERSYANASELMYDDIWLNLWYDPILQPDYACGNIGRLLRLPGSYNHKTKYGLKPHKVEILEYKEENSPLVARMKDHIKEHNRILKHIIKEDIRLLNAFGGIVGPLRLVKNGEETFDRINSEINIADLVCEYTGRKLASNGVNFISNKDRNYTGAYLIPEENIVIWVGSPHISDTYKAYSPFAFLMVHYANGDAKRTFEIAKEKFPWLKDKKSKFLYDVKLVKNGGHK